MLFKSAVVIGDTTLFTVTFAFLRAMTSNGLADRLFVFVSNCYFCGCPNMLDSMCQKELIPATWIVKAVQDQKLRRYLTHKIVKTRTQLNG